MKDKFEKKHEEIEGYTQDVQPGVEHEMEPKPIIEDEDYKAGGKLKGKVALVTGGDSGIGEATAILFAKEGADVAISYYDEDTDAQYAIKRLQEIGAKAKAYSHDLKKDNHAEELVNNVIQDFGKINILVNNGGIQYPQNNFEDISKSQLQETFETNFFGMFYLSQAVLPHLNKGDAIVNTTSVTAYRGSAHLIDYSATKGAIV